MQREWLAYFSISLIAAGKSGIADRVSVFCLFVKIHCSPSTPFLICNFFSFLTSAYAKPVKQQNRKHHVLVLNVRLQIVYPPFVVILLVKETPAALLLIFPYSLQKG